MTKQPLLVLSISLAVGIFTASFLPFSLTVGLWILGFVLLIIFPFLKNQKISNICLLSVCFLVGIFLYDFKIYFPSSDRIDQLSKAKTFIQIQGEIVDFVQISGLKQIIVDVHSTHEDHRWFSANGKVLVKGGENCLLNRFDKIELEGKILQRPFSNFSHEEGFPVWLKSQGVVLVVKVSSAKSIHLLQSDQISFEKRIEQFRQFTNHNLEKGISRDSTVLPLLQAMIVGSRENVSPELKSSFLYTGTIHILSISGLHLTVILLCILFVLGLFSFPKTGVYILALLSIWIYSFMTGLAPPILRSAIMATFFLIGRILKRKSNLSNALGGSALGMLLYNPLSLFDPGFQLSFLCLLALIFLTPILEKDLIFLQKIPQRFFPLLDKRERLFEKMMQWIIKTLSSSLAVWIGVFPLIAYHFHVFSPITILANLLAVPLVGIVMNVGFVVGLLGFSDFVAVPLNMMNEVFLSFLVSSMDLFSKFPGAYFFINRPSWLWMISFYAILFLGLWKGTQKIKTSYFWLIALSLVVFLFPARHENILKLSSFSRGQVNIQMMEWNKKYSLWLNGIDTTSIEEPWLHQLLFLLKVKEINHLFIPKTESSLKTSVFQIVKSQTLDSLPLSLMENIKVEISPEGELEKLYYQDQWMIWFRAGTFEKLRMEKMQGEGVVFIEDKVDVEAFLKWMDHQKIKAVFLKEGFQKYLSEEIKARRISLFEGERACSFVLECDGKSFKMSSVSDR